MIPRVKISVSEDTANYYTTTVPFVPVVIMHTMSGNIGTKELVRSENEFVNKFGKATVDTPSAYAIQSYLRTYSYLYVTRVASESAAIGQATMSVEDIDLINFKTNYKTSLLNGTEIHLIYDAENTKLYLSTVINSVAVSSIKETIDLSSAKADALSIALSKICDSMNAMNLGFTTTNLFVDKTTEDTMPSITDVVTAIAEGDSGLEKVEDANILAMVDMYAQSGMSIDVMVIPEYTSATVVNGATAKAEDYGFMVITSPSSRDVSSCITDIQEYSKSESLAVYFPDVTYTNFNANIPASIAVLTAYARNDNINKWLAPAGTTRGLLNLVSGLAVQMNDDDLDTLYNNVIPVNPIKLVDNIGYTVWGQKTTATSDVYMDRINISRLVKYVYREINTISNTYLFEGITENTFTNWGLQVSALLDKLKTGNAISDYSYKMDSENNTEETISQNMLIGSVRIKPVEVAEFIDIDFVLTSQV